MKNRPITVTLEVLVDAEKIAGLEPIRIFEEMLDPIDVLAEDLRMSALDAIRKLILGDGAWSNVGLGACIWEAKVRIGQEVESTLEPF